MRFCEARAIADAGIEVDKFLLLDVPDDDLVERGCGRRLDPETGRVYHMKFDPPPEDIKGRLTRRSDDEEGTIRTRLQTYRTQIESILPYFRDVVFKFDGTAKPDVVFGHIEQVTCATVTGAIPRIML